MGGLLTKPCNVFPSPNDNAELRTKDSAATAELGKTAPASAIHFSAHVLDLNPSRVMQDGQQGMPAWPVIDISAEVGAAAASPLAGNRTTEIAIRATRIARARTMVIIRPHRDK